jgi:MoaA/NifB/PqqE/SkfB family radical SAM enzyme
MASTVTTETHGQLAVLNWRTLSDERAANVRPNQKIRRAALILTGACNFECPYCQTLGGDRAPTADREITMALVRWMIEQGLQELRLSGGEPTLVSWLPELVSVAVGSGVRVAISTNGYARRPVYDALVKAGVAEFSISLDSVTPEEADRLAGGRPKVLERVTETIQYLTDLGVSVYIGMTCCASRQRPEETLATVEKIISLGATDIKIMSIAQEGGVVETSWLTEEMAERFPFLAWRAHNFRRGRDVRGLTACDSHKCPLVLDDVTISGDKHYPCNVYFREGGDPIGDVGKSMMAERAAWNAQHDTHEDRICRRMCMDLLREYNNRVRELNPHV